jgi:hypothetical protein
MCDPRSYLTCRDIRYKTHGEIVVEAIGATAENQQKFVEMWRQHFLDHMQPKFLAPTWRVNKPLYKLASSSNRAANADADVPTDAAAPLPDAPH